MDLFTKESTVSIYKIEPYDVIKNSDHLLRFLAMIAEHEPMYPNILKWVNDKVLPDIVSGKRIAYLGYNDEAPIAVAILKLGSVAKFCHLSIKKSHTNQNLGELFFILMALNVRSESKKVYFTLPESLWTEKGEFFKSFSFSNISKSTTQYRNGVEELYSETSTRELMRAVSEKLPKIHEMNRRVNDDIQNGLVLSVKPIYANQIMSQTKTVEIRRQFNKAHIGRTIVIYSTKPDCSLLGTARISNIVIGTPESIWKQFSDKIGVTYEEYERYCSGTTNVFAIKLSEITPFKIPIFINQLRQILNIDLNPPQSHSLISNSDDWAKAVSVSQLLFKQFETYHFYYNN